MLHDYIQRHRTVFRGDRVTDLLCIAFSVSEVQGFVGVLFTRAPESLVAQQFWRGDASDLGVVFKVIVTKDRKWPLGLRIALEPKKPVAGGCNRRQKVSGSRKKWRRAIPFSGIARLQKNRGETAEGLSPFLHFSCFHPHHIRPFLTSTISFPL